MSRESRHKKPHGKVVQPPSTRSTNAGDAPPFEFKPPLQPRKPLFIGLCAIFALWIGLLLVMYFTTIYPHHKNPPGNGNPSGPATGPSR